MVSDISPTGTVSVNGLISGLDTTSIIDQLVAIQTQRIALFQSKQAIQTEKVAIFQQLQAIYLGLRAAASALKPTSLYDQKTGGTSDAAVLGVTAATNAAVDTHKITVRQLAAKNQFVSNRFQNTDTTTLGAGELKITVGTGANAVTTTLTVDSTNNTLAGIENLINSSGAKVKATIVKVDSSAAPFQLIVTANEAGEANAISITHDATIKSSATAEILGIGAITNTQDTEDSDAKTYALRQLPNAGTVTVKIGGATITVSLSAPTGVSAAASLDGGTLVDGREYAYVVSAVDASGETLQSTFTVALADANKSIDFNFDDVDGATSYRIYRVDQTEYATPGAGNAIAADFQDQDSLIGTVTDDGSVSFTFSDTGQAQQASQRALVTATQGYTLTESTGAVVFNSDQSGTVTADYEFDLEFLEIQTAKDAIVDLGEGAGALSIRKSTNEITDLIEGVTLSLKKVDTENPILITITKNTFGVSNAVQSFVSALNEANTFIATHTFFDQNSGSTGALFSDPNLLTLRTKISNIVTSPVKSVLPGRLRSLAEVGISLSPETGTYLLSNAKLTSLLGSKPEEVRDVFASVGTTDDVDVEFVGFNDKTETSSGLGYAVNITQAATRAEIVGAQDVSGGITVEETVTITVGSANATAILTAGLSAEKAVSAINSALESQGLSDIVATYNSTTGKITVRHSKYGSDKSFKVTSTQTGATSGASGLGGASATAVTTFSGQDVKGTIAGEAATGVGNLLTGDSGNANTDGLKIKVNIGVSSLLTQGSAQGVVVISRGLATELEDYLNFLTDESKDGPIQIGIDQANDKVKDLQDSIDRFTAQAIRQRAKLLKEFASLEQALGSLQTTSTFLDGQLKQFAATSAAIIAKKSR